MGDSMLSTAAIKSKEAMGAFNARRASLMPPVSQQEQTVSAAATLGEGLAKRDEQGNKVKFSLKELQAKPNRTKAEERMLQMALRHCKK